MKILDISKFKTSFVLYAAALKVEEIFSKADSVFQSRGTINFYIPCEEFVPNYSHIYEVAGQGVWIEYNYNENEIREAIETVLKDPNFVNYFGSWVVANGTDYVKRNVQLKADIPVSNVFLFMFDQPIVSYVNILEMK